MDYSIELLKERLDKLNSSYLEFVTNGSVDKENKVAKENRDKALDCEKAIMVLEENNNNE